MRTTRYATVPDITRRQINSSPLLRYNICMAIPNASRRRQKTPPPGDTGQEALYLRFLSEKQVPIAVKLRDGETVTGWIEYFDDHMIRLTREGKPNLFIYKNQIRTITEQASRHGSRVRHARKSGDEGEGTLNGEQK